MAPLPTRAMRLLFSLMLGCLLVSSAAAQVQRTVVHMLAALPEGVQSVAVVNREAYGDKDSVWAPFPSPFDAMSALRLGASDRSSADQLIAGLKPRWLVCATMRFQGPHNELGPPAVDSVVIAVCPEDVPAVEVLRKSGAVDAPGEVPAGWVALTRSVPRRGKPDQVVSTSMLVLPGGILIAGTRASDVRHIADALVAGGADAEAVLNRRWGKAAALISENGVLQILREFTVSEQRILPVFDTPAREGDARNFLHFVVPSGAKIAGELRAFSSVRDEWVLEELLGEHTTFEATPDGFVLRWGEIPADSPDIRGNVQLKPLHVFGVPLFI